MRRGQTVTLSTANPILYPDLAPGEPLLVTWGGWCDYHGEGCCETRRVSDKKRFHVADIHLASKAGK
jgi:hypothetical protein